MNYPFFDWLLVVCSTNKSPAVNLVLNATAGWQDMVFWLICTLFGRKWRASIHLFSSGAKCCITSQIFWNKINSATPQHTKKTIMGSPKISTSRYIDTQSPTGISGPPARLHICVHPSLFTFYDELRLSVTHLFDSVSGFLLLPLCSDSLGFETILCGSQSTTAAESLFFQPPVAHLTWQLLDNKCLNEIINESCQTSTVSSIRASSC